MISYFNQKGSLPTCEDSLTATVIDLLKYLPDDIFLQILNKSLYNETLDLENQEILNIEYWPKWPASFPEGFDEIYAEIGNTNFVEPDIFISLTDYDIIVEAKRWDRNQQDKRKKEDQVKREILAYKKKFEVDKEHKTTYLIQLGGLLHTQTEIFCDIKILKTDWSKILEQITYLSDTLKRAKQQSKNEKAQIRLLDDLILGFLLHRLFRLEWLQDFTIETPLNTNNIELNKLFTYANQ